MAGEDIVIAPLDRERLDELIDVQNEIFSDYVIPIRSSRAFFLDFLRSVGGDLGNVLVALRGDEMVGYVNPVIDAREAWIGGIGVVPDMRGRGIGTKLMHAAEEHCRRKGADVVFLEVIEANQRAHALYRRLGYADTRKFISAEGKPTRYEGYGEEPQKATLAEIVALHEKAYKDTCWQRRKTPAVMQFARSAECYKVKGGFVLVRTIDTGGFVPFLGVLPEMRGGGVGTALMKFALSKLFDLGAFKVALYNVNDDLPTTRLLDKFDFAVTMKQVEMEKLLRASR